MKNRIIIIGMIAFMTLMSCAKKEIKVACVGDSITEGYGFSPQSQLAYPAILGKILGGEYAVMNFGRSATTLQYKGDFPYWTAKEYTNVFNFKPDIIVIKLGTNDTKPRNWKGTEQFETDCQIMIDTFMTIIPQPKIFLCKPVPVFKTRWGINDSTIVYGVIPVVEKIAKANNLPVIDLYNTMIDQGANFFDSIHPNPEAAEVMAGIVAEAIKEE
ncbi:MAG: sialate O-acetylesterase [Prolixibacteraceae bacterium]|nr:sialate O-acetylesterase [Prolixibacteraceae bacterium]